MKLSYEPNRVVGAGAAVVMAALGLLVYYDVLDVEGAGLWGALAFAIIPPVQAEIARRFTWSTAKIADAATVDPSLHPEAINQKARQGRRRKEVAKEASV